MPAPSPASIRIEGLSHRYPGAERFAVEDAGFSVDPGLRVGLLGPNGAGKTTLMRILCGYLPVQDHRGKYPARVEVAGLDVRTDSLAVRSRVGYLSEQVPVYPELRVREHLTFRARIKRVGRRAIRTEIQRVADLTGIADKLETPIGHLSRGYRQRVGISDALLGAPPLLVLDEPTVGLDPNQVLEMRSMLRALGGRQTLVFSSHILAEVEALCDRVVILSHGKVVVDASLEQALAAGHVCARWQTDRTTAGRIVNATWRELGQATAPASELHEHGDEVEAMLPLSADGPDAEDVLRAVGRASAREGVALVSLLPGRTRLEERFAEVTGAARGNRG